MTTYRSPRVWLVSLAALAGIAGSFSLARSAPEAGSAPRWIWSEADPKVDQTAYFRKVIDVPDGVTSAKLIATCDNEVELLIDGKRVLLNKEWATPVTKDVTAALVGTGRGRARGGRHVLAAKCKNEGGPAGLLVRLTMKTRAGDAITIVSDDSWKASGAAEQSGWSGPGFDDQGWSKAVALANLGGGAWASVNEAALAAAEQDGEPQAPAAEGFKVAKGFKVELLYSVPKDEQGSWVNMSVDPEGPADRLRPVRQALPRHPARRSAATRRRRRSSRSTSTSARPRACSGRSTASTSSSTAARSTRAACTASRDTNGDDTLDKVELLRDARGRRRARPARRDPARPDGKSLYVVCGNADEADRARPARSCRRIWGEDHLLPRHARRQRLHGGRARPRRLHLPRRPRRQELGARRRSASATSTTLAFNRHGDLFTYDADMEWDINTPWYRPDPRLPGRPAARSSAGATARASGRPTTPTASRRREHRPRLADRRGFGYGAKFPAKYQDALFICDWSYGKLYAVHLTPEGSALQGRARGVRHRHAAAADRRRRQPERRGDVLRHRRPQDQSGLYRVTYAGEESTEPSRGDDGRRRGPRPAPHRSKPSTATRTRRPSRPPGRTSATPTASSASPPASRSSTRTRTWQDRALAETNPQASLDRALPGPRPAPATRPTPAEAPRSRSAGCDWDELWTSRRSSSLCASTRSRSSAWASPTPRRPRRHHRQARRALPRPGTRAERRAAASCSSPSRPRRRRRRRWPCWPTPRRRRSRSSTPAALRNAQARAGRPSCARSISPGSSRRPTTRAGPASAASCARSRRTPSRPSPPRRRPR